MPDFQPLLRVASSKSRRKSNRRQVGTQIECEFNAEAVTKCISNIRQRVHKPRILYNLISSGSAKLSRNRVIASRTDKIARISPKARLKSKYAGHHSWHSLVDNVGCNPFYRTVEDEHI